MRTANLSCWPAVPSAMEMDLSFPGSSGCLLYANLLGEDELWIRHCGSSILQEPAGRWEDNELVEVWVYGEQWTALSEPAYRQGYG